MIEIKITLQEVKMNGGLPGCTFEQRVRDSEPTAEEKRSFVIFDTAIRDALTAIMKFYQNGELVEGTTETVTAVKESIRKQHGLN